MNVSELYGTAGSDDLSLLLHHAAVGRNWRTVAYIKDTFARLDAKDITDDCAASCIAEAWYELGPDEQRLLWRAPLYGGWLTTAERHFIKTRLKRPLAIE